MYVSYMLRNMKNIEWRFGSFAQYIFKLVNVYLGHNNRVPFLSLVFEVLYTVRYLHCEIKADIKYSYARVFIEV